MYVRPVDAVAMVVSTGLYGRRVVTGFTKEIIIKSYRLIRSRVCSDKNCAQIQFSYTENGKNYVSFTSSGVIMTQLAEYKDKMPFLTTICKRRRYFALS